MSRKAHSGPKVVNALDHNDVPMVACPSDSTVLPEFPTDAFDFLQERPESEPRTETPFLVSADVNPWPEIRKRLTVRQFEIFEYVYKLQMAVSDVSRVTGLSAKAVHRVLGQAKRRLRKSLGAEE